MKIFIVVFAMLSSAQALAWNEVTVRPDGVGGYYYEHWDMANGGIDWGTIRPDRRGGYTISIIGTVDEMREDRRDWRRERRRYLED